jgi:O-antigen/teichoic acid export membrane protein
LSNVRVTYSGLISFVITISTLFTGIIFTLIVTRRLSPEDLGTWSLIGGLITYVLVIEPIISSWSTREIARGVKSAKTAIVSSTSFSLIGIIAYLIIAFFVSQNSEVKIEILFFGVIMIPLLFLNRTLTSINLGSKPQAVSYGTIGFEIAKIPVGIVFVYFLDWGVQGAIIATSMAYVIGNSILFYSAKDQIVNGIKKEFLRKWLKLSWLSLYSGKLHATIQYFDVLIFTMITGSVIGLSYWTVAMAIAVIVGHSGAISNGLYAKILDGSKGEFFGENFRLVLFFAIPLFIFTITFARPGLFTLNPIYEGAVLVVVFLAIRVLFQTINNIFETSLKGLEKIDLKQNTTFRDYLNSKLFFLPSLTIIQKIGYVTSLAIVLLITTQEAKTDLELITYWAIIAAIVPIPFTLYRLKLVLRHFKFNIEILDLIKYTLTSIGIFSFVYLLMEEFLEYEKEIFVFLPNVLIYVIFSFLVYFGILVLIDKKTKNLTKAILMEIKKR